MFMLQKLIAMISSADDSMNFECLESVVVPVAGRFPASDRWPGAGEGRAATSLGTGAPLFSSRPPHCLRSVCSRPPPQHQFKHPVCTSAEVEGSDGRALFHPFPRGPYFRTCAARQERQARASFHQKTETRASSRNSGEDIVGTW